MKKILFMIIFSIINTQDICAAQIIGKIGATEPVSSYLGGVLGVKKTQPKLSANKMVSADFPVKTESLSPGVVEEKVIHANTLNHPIFLVGDDELSKIWLEKYSNRLKSIHAVGFIVNTEGNEETKAIENKFHIILIPVNGVELAKRFHLRHYPVLISKNRIEQ